MKVLVTGAGGFIGNYLVGLLLKKGHTVIGLDNESKYGKGIGSFPQFSSYRYVKGDAKDVILLKRLLRDCDHVIAGAAKIGGIGYFHRYAYDLLAENERIMAATLDAAIYAHQHYSLKKITVISSSMVYESAKIFPTPEKAVRTSPPPQSTYGFQKLACEYFVKGAWEQYKLPYTIVRPFNCVGVGEIDSLGKKTLKKGEITRALSHVVPDLIVKTLEGQNPIHIVGKGNQIRHYTYGVDLAKGIYMAMMSKKALNEDFNLSTAETTTVLQLAKTIWKKINGKTPFRYVCDEPFLYDVQKRIPDTEKAKRILGFTAETSLDTMLDIVIAWIRQSVI